MPAIRIFRRLRDLLDVTFGTPADGDSLIYDQGTDKFVFSAVSGGSGAPTDADYLVGTANGSLSAEIVVGTSPGGELGGTWASPTVDATHSGSSHASVQSAAEATAAAALSAAVAGLSSVYQPLDSDLTAIAALTTTSFGRAVLALADAAALRTAAGLGTAAVAATGDFDAAGAAAAAQAASQPLDSDLTAIAALTTTSFGRAFLALADAAAGRTALGLGTLATQSGTFSGTSSGTNTGDQTSVSGNAGTATALATGRAIDGQTFDGTAAITVIAPGTHAATGKTTPVDADELPIVDSAASNVLKKLTWANLKATLKTYFDTLYPSGSGTSSGTNTGDQTISDATISTTDITTNNASTSKHGFLKKLDNTATHFMDGTGAWSTPAAAVTLASALDALQPVGARVYLNPFHAETADTNWHNYAAPIASASMGSRESSGAQNAEVTFKIALAAGTWTLHLFTLTGSNLGIVTVSLNTVSQGTIDLYTAGLTANVKKTLTGVAPGTSALHDLNFKMATKNASASTFFGELISITLERTA